MWSVYVVEVEKVHHLLTHIEWIDLFEEINLVAMLLQNHVFFVLPIVFVWEAREENVFVILSVSCWFWTSFDSISMSFGNIEKNIHECVRDFLNCTIFNRSIL